MAERELDVYEAKFDLTGEACGDKIRQDAGTGSRVHDPGSGPAAGAG